MNKRFVPDTKYAAAIEAILALKPSAIDGKVTFDQIAIALGEFGDVWPEGLSAIVE
jgi:hypothetical protein